MSSPLNRNIDATSKISLYYNSTSSIYFVLNLRENRTPSTIRSAGFVDTDGRWNCLFLSHQTRIFDILHQFESLNFFALIQTLNMTIFLRLNFVVILMHGNYVNNKLWHWKDIFWTSTMGFLLHLMFVVKKKESKSWEWISLPLSSEFFLIKYTNVY